MIVTKLDLSELSNTKEVHENALGKGVQYAIQQNSSSVSEVLKTIDSSRILSLQKQIEQQIYPYQKMMNDILGPQSAIGEFSRIMENVLEPLNGLKLRDLIQPSALESFINSMEQLRQPFENITAINAMIDGIHPTALERLNKQMEGVNSATFLRALQSSIKDGSFEEIAKSEDTYYEELTNSDVEEIEKVANDQLSAKDLSERAKAFIRCLFLYFLLPYLAAVAADATDSKKEKRVERVDVKQIAKQVRADTAAEERKSLRLIEGENLRLRMGPSVKDPVIATLQIGTLVEVIDNSDRSWLMVQVQYEGTNYAGWVFRRYTKHLNYK